MTKHIALSVNDKPIELSYFLQGFIDHTAGGMVEALEGTGEVKTLDISIEADSVIINLNNTSVPLNPFVSRVIRNTIFGIVSSLKGASKISKTNISIKR